MYQFLERGIRGGQSVIFKKYAKANNKYLSDYNPEEPSTYISYLDANNLNGIAMSCKLPQGEFQWVNGNDISIDDIMNYNEGTDTIYTMIIPSRVKDINRKAIIAINYVEHSMTKRIISSILKIYSYIKN